MKGIGSVFWLALIGLLAIGVYFGGGYAGLWSIPSGNYILNPQYGTYACLSGGQVKNENVPAVFHPSTFWEGSFYDGYMKCPGNAQTCEFGYKLTCQALFGCTFTGGYEFKNIYDVSKGWQTATPTTLVYNEVKTVWVSGTALTGEAIYFKIYNTQTPVIYGAMRYEKYQLVQTAANGYTAIANTDGCERPTVVQPIGDDTVPPELCISGCVQNIAGNRVPFNDYWNYLGGYSLAPSSDLHTDPTDSQLVYCQPVGSYAVLRSLKTLTTTKASYYVVDALKRDVECCPGQTLGSSYCGSDFKWSSTPSCTEGYCDAFSTISSCPGAGSWIADLSDPYRKTLFRATGCDGSGCCVMQTQNVQCTSSSQCVDPNKPVCKNYVCVASGTDPFLPFCGNAVCENGENDQNSQYYCPQDCVSVPSCGDGTCDQGESPANCPVDCPISGGWENAIWIPLFVVLFGAIGYFKREWLGAIIGGVGGLIAGILVYGFLSMAWWQQAGLVLLLGGAGVLVGYLVVLAIPLIIAALIALK